MSTWRSRYGIGTAIDNALIRWPPSPAMIALFGRLSGQHRSGNVQKGAQCARHIGVAMADEHGLDRTLAAGQTMGAHAALPPDRPDQAFGQQGDAESGADTAH